MSESSNNSALPKQPYKYQGIELERNFGLETYETFYRGLDPQIGRFNSVDPKSEKYFDVSPYVSMNNNPIGNVDPRGDDWFVNTITGGVVYAKGVSAMTQQVLSENRFGDVAKNYERLGPDNMFGNKVTVNLYENNVLDAKFVNIENPEEFMNTKGYDKAEKVDIKETLHASSGSVGFEERVSTTVEDIKQIGVSKITYAKPQDMNKKYRITDLTIPGRYSSIRNVSYSLVKPFGQSINKTAIIYENRKNDVSAQNASTTKSLYEVLLKVFKRK